MKNVRNLFVFTSVLLLGACGHYSDELSSLDKGMKAQPAVYAQNAAPQDIAPAAGGAAMTGTMAQNLARDYYDLARYENDKAYDYKAAKNYTQKAMMASKGQVPMPARLSDYDVPSDKIADLKSARASLVEALKTQNTPENQQILAKAQTSFDCWIEREEEATNDAHPASCKGEFEQSMAMLIMPAAGNAAPTVYDIGFAANSAIVDDASKKTLEYVAQFLNAPENAGYTARLIGFTEGQGEFADKLMTTRVTAVRDIMIAKNISPDRLEPMVANEIAQPQQARKVQVSLMAPQAGSGVSPSSTSTFVPVTPKKVDPSRIPQGAIVVPAQ